MYRRSIFRGALASFIGIAATAFNRDGAPAATRQVEDEKSSADPSALTLIVIRHAERPDNPSLGPGVTAQGQTDPLSLTVRGWERAGALAMLFDSDCRNADFPRPDVVFAANPHAPQTVDNLVSKRPHQTIMPLCQKLGTTPIIDYGLGDEVALLNAARQKSGVVLICWEHFRIIAGLLPAFEKIQRFTGFPTKWDDARYDVALRFDRPRHNAPWSYRQIFPNLLAGDTNAPLQ